MTRKTARSNNLPPRPRRHLIAIGAVATALALCACGTAATGPDAAATSAGASGATAPPSAEANRLALESGWAKAGSGMTAVFGRVRNGTDRPVTIVGGSSPAATAVEVHTMAKQPDGSMKMTRKEGGLVVAPGTTVELSPGGDHLMLLGLRSPLGNGEEVTVVVETAEGAKVEWTVPVRAFAGAEESYAPGTGTSPATGGH